MEDRWTTGDVAALLCNPFLYVFTESSWIASNGRAILRFGPRRWLYALLAALQQRHVPGSPTVAEPRVADPYEAIMVAPALCMEHPPLVTADVWVAANVQGLNDQLAADWLANLLAVLKGAYAT